MKKPHITRLSTRRKGALYSYQVVDRKKVLDRVMAERAWSQR